MKPFQISSYFFVGIILLMSCTSYHVMTVNDHDMHYAQMDMERESDNYYSDFTFYLNRDSTVYMLFAPQFVHQQDSVAVTGILKEVRKDIISENLCETEPDKILKENKHSRVHYHLSNDSLSIEPDEIITFTNSDVQKVTIYNWSNEKSENTNGKTGLVLVISAAVVGIITWIVVELSTMKIPLNFKW